MAGTTDPLSNCRVWRSRHIARAVSMGGGGSVTGDHHSLTGGHVGFCGCSSLLIAGTDSLPVSLAVPMHQYHRCAATNQRSVIMSGLLKGQRLSALWIVKNNSFRMMLKHWQNFLHNVRARRQRWIYSGPEYFFLQYGMSVETQYFIEYLVAALSSICHNFLGQVCKITCDLGSHHASWGDPGT